jgi:hypothetical protein
VNAIVGSKKQPITFDDHPVNVPERRLYLHKGSRALTREERAQLNNFLFLRHDDLASKRRHSRIRAAGQDILSHHHCTLMVFDHVLSEHRIESWSLR